jgi:hypothetical protein
MVADNLTVSTWTGCVCSVFRKLATLTPLAWGFFVGSVYADEIPYHNPATGGYYKSRDEACEAALPAIQAQETREGVVYEYSYAASSCRYKVTYPSGNTVITSVSVGDVTSAAVQLSSCVAGEEKSLTWPAGRYLIPGDENSYQDFGSSPPSAACFSGCNANRSGFSGDPYYSESSADLIVQDLPYTTDGTACSADGASPVVPDFPPAPDDGDDGGTGGGDTGGGDTGGGDDGSGTGDGGSGGGTGGGSGGSSGGGSGGGGDTGGGDTGGDTGGGDTGGSTGGSTGGDDGAGNSAGGLACNQPLTCEGDPVQCAILRTQKDQLCSDLDGADFEGHKSDIESLFSGPDFQREADEEVTVPSFVTGITRFFPSNSCPADAAVSLSSFGGRTLKFSFEPICSFATALGPLIVIAATVFAALYVGRAFGGE